jgi:hypothetical protein
MKFQKRQTKVTPGDYTVTILPLATAKTYLFEGAGTDQDAIITALIRGAVQTLEAGLDFIIDTSGLIDQYYDGFPTDGMIPIWHRYIKTTDLVVEYWNDTTWTAVSSSNYRIDISSNPPKVFLKSTGEWPSDISDDGLNTVRIGFKVDHSLSFIDELRGAAMALVAARYENREAGDIPITVQAFIDRHKLHS